MVFSLEFVDDDVDNCLIVFGFECFDKRRVFECDAGFDVVLVAQGGECV